MPTELSRFQISGTSIAVPPAIETAADIAARIDRDEQWVRETTGVCKRHVCVPGDDPAKLAAQAAAPVLEQCGTPDLLIYAGATHRQCVPDTSVFVARELGIEGVACCSLNATCLSFLVALRNAAALIASGFHQKVLIVSTEQPSLARDFGHPESAALLGDGAAAAMIESTDQDAGLLGYQFQTWPAYAELAQIRGGGHLCHPTYKTTTDADHHFEMDGEKLLRAVLLKSPKFFKRFFGEAQLTAEDVDLFIPHQASAAGMKLLQRLGFPADRTVNIIAEYGNCVSASLPMALATAHRDGRIKSGDRIMMVGSAAGLSIGAAIIRWQ